MNSFCFQIKKMNSFCFQILFFLLNVFYRSSYTHSTYAHTQSFKLIHLFHSHSFVHSNQRRCLLYKSYGERLCVDRVNEKACSDVGKKYCITTFFTEICLKCEWKSQKVSLY